MTRRAPLLTAAGIAVVTLVAGGVSAALLLALLGYTANEVDLVADAAMAGTVSEAPPAPTPDDPAAVALMERAGRASDTVAYVGMVITSGVGAPAPVAMTVRGIPGVGTVVSGAGGAAVLAGEGRSASLADFSQVLDVLVANYRVLRAQVEDRVIADRPALAVVADRPDGTLAARFWLDSRTGLLLRRDLVGRGGNTTTSTWFQVLDLGGPAVDHLPPLAADGWSHLLDPGDRAAWRAAGCTCAESLPDGMRLLQARTDDAGIAAGPGQGVVHLLYSDGLTEVSIFDQPGQLAPDATEQLTDDRFTPVTYDGVPVLERVTPATRGITAVASGEWVWQCGASVLTLVGPATPRAAADERAGEIVSALYRGSPAASRAGAEGPVAWVRRGWDRVAAAARRSWDHLTASSGSSQVGAVDWGALHWAG